MRILEYLPDKIEDVIKLEVLEQSNKLEEIRLRVRTTYSFEIEWWGKNN